MMIEGNIIHQIISTINHINWFSLSQSFLFDSDNQIAQR